MKGIITAPRKIITGAFTMLFTFIRALELTADDVVVETLEGDALGHTKDSFGGSGASYHILCYLPDERKGKSRISVVKEGVDVPPVIVEYDTIRTVHATWRTPIRQNGKIEVPVAFDAPIQHLKKRNFRLSVPAPFQLYGTDTAYRVVLPDRNSPFSVAVSGTVRKLNGIVAEIVQSALEVKQ